MNDAELYHTNNSVQRRDAIQCLEEYAKQIKWNNNGATIIDIGCGDGGVTTSILKRFIPNNCKELIGCDISENMIQFANSHHAKDFIRFIVLDIGGDLPDQLREKFDHAFSFSALHWIKPQKNAFSNIYNLLVRGGDGLFMFLAHNPLYEVFRELGRSPRWNCWLKDMDGFVTPYQDCQDPAKDVKIMMTSIGFTNVEVKCLERVYVYSGKDEFMDSMKSVNPFHIPLEMREDFYADFIKVVHDMKLVDNVNNTEDGLGNVKIDYKLIIARGKK